MLCDDLGRWEWGIGREAQEEGDICILMADLHHCHCMAETNTTW